MITPKVHLAVIRPVLRKAIVNTAWATLGLSLAATVSALADGPARVRVTGRVHENQRGLAGIVISANPGGLTAITGSEGVYSLLLPYAPSGWSGAITPHGAGYDFAPKRISLQAVRNDVPHLDFGASLRPGERPPADRSSHVDPLPVPPMSAERAAETDSAPSTDRRASSYMPWWVSWRTRAAAPPNLDPVDVAEGAAASTLVPQALPQSVLAFRNTMKHIVLLGRDAAGNTSLAAGAAPLSFTVVSKPAHGDLYGDPPRVMYVPHEGHLGTDQFSFFVNQGEIFSPPAEATITIADWSAPLAIAPPPFGIMETAPPYNQTNPLHYYVNNAYPGATDSANPRGSPEHPRLTIPINLAAGALVEVRGGPYVYGSVNGNTALGITGQGTAQSPIFIRGGGPTERPQFNRSTRIIGSYIVLEHLDFDAASGPHNGGVLVAVPSRNVCVRHCEVRNRHGGPDGALLAANYGTIKPEDETTWVRNVVFFNNLIHDNGNYYDTGDEDHRGIGVGGGVTHVWILDNEVYHHSADGIQCNTSYGSPNYLIQHIYAGRNRIHHNKQGGFWAKESSDVIVSQNEIFGHRPSSSSDGHGAGCQYLPDRVWFLFNRIYDCELGVIGPGASGLFVIGNVIHDIHHTTTAYNPADPYAGGWAVHVRNSQTAYVVGNTIFDVDSGIAGVTSTAVHVVNNVIAHRTEALARDVFHQYAETANASEMRNNLMPPPGRINWGSPSAVLSLQSFQAATAKGQGCAAADPYLTDVAAGDGRPLPNSPAVNAGIEHEVYESFRAIYGIDIGFDITGAPRSQGASIDIGAYEQP